MHKENKTAGSNNILTWKQMLGNKNYDKVSQAITEEYNERHHLLKEYKKNMIVTSINTICMMVKCYTF